MNYSTCPRHGTYLLQCEACADEAATARMNTKDTPPAGAPAAAPAAEAQLWRGGEIDAALLRDIEKHPHGLRAGIAWGLAVLMGRHAYDVLVPLDQYEAMQAALSARSATPPPGFVLVPKVADDNIRRALLCFHDKAELDASDVVWADDLWTDVLAARPATDPAATTKDSGAASEECGKDRGAASLTSNAAPNSLSVVTSEPK